VTAARALIALPWLLSSFRYRRLAHSLPSGTSCIRYRDTHDTCAVSRYFLLLRYTAVVSSRRYRRYLRLVSTISIVVSWVSHNTSRKWHFKLFSFLLLARCVPNITKRSIYEISVRRSRPMYWGPTDRPTTDLTFGKISNGHISARGRPIHFMFCSTVGFSRSVDRMALFLVLPNPRWRLGRHLEFDQIQYVCGRHNARRVIRLLTV